MIAGMTYCQICWYFLLYSFLGWVIEVACHAVTLGKVENRGFLNGPVCPVYGFGRNWQNSTGSWRSASRNWRMLFWEERCLAAEDC